MSLSYFFRKKRPGQNSIEELFGHLIDTIQSVHPVNRFELPCSGAGPAGLLYNMIYSVRRKTGVNHVTGDVYYLGIVLGKSGVLTYHDVKSVLRGSTVKRFYLFLLWFWWPCKRVKYITTISEFTKNEMLEVMPWTKNKIKVIYNAFSHVLLDHSVSKKRCDETFRVLVIGTKPNKNLDRITRSLQGSDLIITIIGRLNQEQLELLNSSKLDFENFFDLEYEAVIEHYLNASVLCFPSTYEGFGMPIIEAQVLGIPVVTSSIGAMKEIAGDSALLVDPYNTEEIKQAILKIKNDCEYRDFLIEKGKQNIQRFHPARIASQYSLLYQEILE